MKYDFESILERKGKDALALDMLGKMPGVYPGAPKEGFDPIPMWVADMNFKTLPNVQQEIIKRVEHPTFGYFVPRDEYFTSIIDWHKRRNGIKNLKKENIGYENGVLGGVVSALNILCSKGDNVLVHSPTYIGFTKSLINNGYHIVHSDLIKDENGKWVMDYQDMEEKIIENNITVSIICNPHNPSGRVWTKEELEKAMEIYQRHHVYVISDEIWSDILINGHKYTPTQSVNDYARENTIALYAPSKTFNLAGLIGAYHIVYNEYLRKRLEKEASLSHYNSMNVLSMYALIGAYKDEGHDWVDQLNEVLSENVNFAYDFIKENFKGVDIYKPQGTYMLFLDLEEYCKKNGKNLDEIIEKGWDCGVIWQDGRPFNGEYAIRMNLALPKARVEEAFKRLKDYVFV